MQSEELGELVYDSKILRVPQIKRRGLGVKRDLGLESLHLSHLLIDMRNPLEGKKSRKDGFEGRQKQVLASLQDLAHTEFLIDLSRGKMIRRNHYRVIQFSKCLDYVKACHLATTVNREKRMNNQGSFQLSSSTSIGY